MVRRGGVGCLCVTLLIFSAGCSGPVWRHYQNVGARGFGQYYAHSTPYPWSDDVRANQAGGLKYAGRIFWYHVIDEYVNGCFPLEQYQRSYRTQASQLPPGFPRVKKQRGKPLVTEWGDWKADGEGYWRYVGPEPKYILYYPAR